MQSEKSLNNAVLLYLSALICFTIINVFNDLCIVNIVYLIILICAILKCVMIINDNRKM